MTRRRYNVSGDLFDNDAREIRAEMARLRILEFRAECRRKAERHARAMRPPARLRRRFPWLLLLAGVAAWLYALSFLFP